jgi:hypothetical protein
LAFNIGNQASVDEMMPGFRRFNPAIFNAIDGSDVHTIRASYSTLD